MLNILNGFSVHKFWCNQTGITYWGYVPAKCSSKVTFKAEDRGGSQEIAGQENSSSAKMCSWLNDSKIYFLKHLPKHNINCGTVHNL